MGKGDRGESVWSFREIHKGSKVIQEPKLELARKRRCIKDSPADFIAGKNKMGITWSKIEDHRGKR